MVLGSSLWFRLARLVTAPHRETVPFRQNSRFRRASLATWETDLQACSTGRTGETFLRKTVGGEAACRRVATTCSLPWRISQAVTGSWRCLNRWCRNLMRYSRFTKSRPVITPSANPCSAELSY